MLASRVVFFPRLRGTEQCARSPRRDHARRTEKERCSRPSRLRRQTALGLSSPRLSPSRRLFAIRLVLSPPQPVFLAEAHTSFEQPPDGRVAQGLGRSALQEATPLGDSGGRTLLDVSASSSFRVTSSALGGLPPPFLLGASDAPRSAILPYRLTEERLTPNRRAAADFDIPLRRAWTILVRRSSE